MFLLLGKGKLLHNYCTSNEIVRDGLSLICCDASVNTVASPIHGDILRPQSSIEVGVGVDTYTQTDSTGVNSVSPFNIEMIADSKELVHFYTGFDDYDNLMICYNFLGPWHCVRNLQYWGKDQRLTNDSRGATCTLSPLNEFFLVLCRLRLGLLEQDLAFRFGISQPTVSRICITLCIASFVK